MEEYIKKAIEYIKSENYECDATRAFVQANEHYSEDSVKAFVDFQNSAAEKINFGEEYLLIFDDNSCYCTWRDTEDAFYLDVSDLCMEDIAIKDFLEKIERSRK